MILSPGQWRHRGDMPPQIRKRAKVFFDYRSLNRVTHRCALHGSNSFLPLICPCDRLEKSRQALCGDILEILTIYKAGEGAQVLEFAIRRGDRAVEGARLEIVCTPNKGTGGSNPPLSAI